MKQGRNGVVLILGLVVSLWAQFNPANFQYSTRIDFDLAAEGITETLTDVPILIRVDETNSYRPTFKDSLRDIRFADASGQLLAHELELYVKDREPALFWVKVPKLDPATENYITMYWGNDTAESIGNGGGVFNSANEHLMTVHMNQKRARDQVGPDTVINSVGQNGSLYFNKGGRSTASDNFLGKRRMLNENFAYTTGPNPIAGLNEFTISFVTDRWLNKGVFLSTAESNELSCSFCIVFPGNSGEKALRNTLMLRAGTSVVHNEPYAMKKNDYNAMVTTVFRANTPANGLQLFMNGELIAETGTEGIGPISNTENNPLFISPLDVGGGFVKGTIDEFRISNIARSAQYIKFVTKQMQQGNALTKYGHPVDRLNPSRSAPALSLLGKLEAEYTLEEGKILKLEMPIEPNYLKVQWFIDGVRVKRDRPTYEFRGNNLNDLYWRVKLNQDGGKLYAKVGFGPDTLTSDTSLIKIFPKDKTPIALIEQPQSKTLQEGQTVEFSVKTNQKSGVKYQWYENDLPIIGATNSKYSKSVAMTDNGNKYKVKASSYNGEIISNEAVLTVTKKPIPIAIQSQPQSLTVMEDNLASFEFNVTPAGVASFEWYKNGVLLPGQTSSKLEFVAPFSDNGSKFYAKAKSPTMELQSEEVILTVNEDLVKKSCVGDVTFPMMDSVNELSEIKIEPQLNGCEITHKWEDASGYLSFDENALNFSAKAPKVDASSDLSLTIRFSYSNYGVAKVKEFEIDVIDAIKAPKLKLDFPSMWSNKDTSEIEIQSQLTNPDELGDLSKIIYSWKVTGTGFDTLTAGSTLRIFNLRKTGRVSIRVCADNQGSFSCESKDLNVVYIPPLHLSAQWILLQRNKSKNQRLQPYYFREGMTAPVSPIGKVHR